jgi:dolichyl-phosphate-mannose-protein mannosyltransferase
VNGILQRLNRPVIAIAAVAVIAGGLRFSDLGHPGRYYFDEAYYAKDGCLYAGFDFKECNLDTNTEISWVHPPLGKWAIALGEKAFGNDPFGWRVASATFGTASVIALALIAWLLYRSALWTFVAGLLLATESLHFVQSRISMLDIFLAFWVTLGFLLLVLDRLWIERRTPEPVTPVAEEAPQHFVAEQEASLGPGAMAVDEPIPPAAVEALDEGHPPTIPSPVLRPWRLAAGVAFGAATATKWSGVFALAGAALLAFVWERTRRKKADDHRPVWHAIRDESFGLVLAFLVVPVVVYLVSYTGEFIGGWGFGLDGLKELWRRQQGMFDFHFHLDTVKAGGEPSHPYLSRPISWLLLRRPVAYYFEGPGTEILGIGNPAIFWASLLTLPYLVISWWRGRDWRAGMIFMAVASQYLPWITFARPQFLFYMTPVVPFLVLAVTHFLRDLSEVRLAGSRSRPFLPVAATFVVVAVGVFAFFWPILTAFPLSREAWGARIWMPTWV